MTDAVPDGVPRPAPLRTVASPTGQALAAGAVVVALAALAVRMDGALWFAAPTAALLVGVACGLQLDLRPWFAAVPGVAAALAALVGLSVLWGVAVGSFDAAWPYAPVPLAAVAVFGADWWWVERLRPTAVASGVLLVVALPGAGEEAAALLLALLWFAVTVAALWSLRRDAGRAVPVPVALDGSAGPTREPGAGKAAAAVAVAWLAAALVVALAGLVPLAFDSPRAGGRPGGDGRVLAPGPGPGSGSGRAGGGSVPDPGGDPVPGIGPAGEGRDVDGDGIVDRDIDGDGIPDVDRDGDGIPDVDRDGDGIPDVDRDGDGIPDGSAGPGATGSPGGTAGGPDPATAPTGDRTARIVGDGDRTAAALRLLGVVVSILLVATLVAVAARALAREWARRRALAARPWPVRLAERLDHEGARRGRARRRDEPVTRYATALAGGVLAHDRLAEVGVALSGALFGGAPPSDATGAWAAAVLDEAVVANPRPTRRAALRARLRRRR